MSTKHKTSDAEAAAALEALEPAAAVRHERAELAELEAAVRDRQAAEDRVESAVRDARSAGLPWTAIAVGLGVSHQAAIKKFGAKA